MQYVWLKTSGAAANYIEIKIFKLSLKLNEYIIIKPFTFQLIMNNLFLINLHSIYTLNFE